MTERLLQYIWQFQHINSGELFTTQGQKLLVIFPGNYNPNQGPDFLNAKIKVDETTWAGNIELHVNSGDWRTHNHSNDRNYDNVILHVVWKDDADLSLSFPTLEIADKVSKLLLNKYMEIMQSRSFIPCEKHIGKIEAVIIGTWKERLLIERLQQKALYIKSLLQKNNQHWEEAFWWLLARNFGTKINSDLFEKTAQSIPVRLLAKHKNQLLQLEALLCGQAGMLSTEFHEDYPLMLQKEYRFLKKKYNLKTVQHPLFYLRMRPANFPTIRMAQLAMVIHKSHHLFDSLKDITDIKVAEALFAVTANDYWHYHYVFDEKSDYKKKVLGKNMISNIMINTVVPMLYAYGYLNKKESISIKALSWMEQIAAEKNNITNGYELLGIINSSAYDSQGLIQLKNEYCDKKRCLQCAIGNKILKERIV